MKITVIIEPAKGIAISAEHDVAPLGTWNLSRRIPTNQLLAYCLTAVNEAIDRTHELGFAQ